MKAYGEKPFHGRGAYGMRNKTSEARPSGFRKAVNKTKVKKAVRSIQRSKARQGQKNIIRQSLKEIE